MKFVFDELFRRDLHVCIASELNIKSVRMTESIELFRRMVIFAMDNSKRFNDVCVCIPGFFANLFQRRFLGSKSLIEASGKERAPAGVRPFEANISIVRPMLHDCNNSATVHNWFCLAECGGTGSLYENWFYNRAYRQSKFLGKLAVAFVVRWDGHDRAGTIRSENIVGDIDWDFFLCRWIDRCDAFELHAGLLLIFAPLPLGLLCSCFYIPSDFFFI